MLTLRAGGLGYKLLMSLMARFFPDEGRLSYQSGDIWQFSEMRSRWDPMTPGILSLSRDIIEFASFSGALELDFSHERRKYDFLFAENELIVIISGVIEVLPSF